MTPLASHGTDATTCHHLTKSHVAPYFSYLNLCYAVVPLMMLMSSCDTDASVSGIKLPNSHVAPHFDCLSLRSEMVPSSALSCHCWFQWQHMTKKSPVAHYFDHRDLWNAVAPLMVLCMSQYADSNAVGSHDTSTNASGII